MRVSTSCGSEWLTVVALCSTAPDAVNTLVWSLTPGTWPPPKTVVGCSRPIPFDSLSAHCSRTIQFFDVWVRNAAPGMYEPGLNVSAANESLSARVQVELMRVACHR